MITAQPVTELKDTIEMMVSEDYKERFKAEYAQVKIREQKLTAMIDKYKAGTLEFILKCPISTYELQLEYMHKYAAVLESRAVMENIVL